MRDLYINLTDDYVDQYPAGFIGESNYTHLIITLPPDLMTDDIVNYKIMFDVGADGMETTARTATNGEIEYTVSEQLTVKSTVPMQVIAFGDSDEIGRSKRVNLLFAESVGVDSVNPGDPDDPLTPVTSVLNVLYGNESVVADRVATIPLPAVRGVHYNGVNALNESGVANIPAPTFPVTDVLFNGASALDGTVAEITVYVPPDPVDDAVSTTITVSPLDDTEYFYGELTALTISAMPTGHYHTRLSFSSGATATTVTVPNTLKWADGTVPTIEASKSYQIDVEDGLAVWREFYAAT